MDRRPTYVSCTCAAFAVLVLPFLGGNAQATPLESVDVVTARVDFNQYSVCRPNSETVDVAIMVSHSGDSQLQMVEMGEVEQRGVYVEPTTGEVEQTESLIAMQQSNNVYLQLGQSTLLYGEMELPTVDGVYREVVDIGWQPAGQQSGFRSSQQVLLDFVVENDCLSWIDAKEFEFLANVPHLYSHQGQPVPQNTRWGGASPGQPVFEIGEFEDGEHDLKDDGLEVLELSYCVKVEYFDNFLFPPEDTTGMVRQPVLGDGSPRDFRGLHVELWDRDADEDNDFITSGILRGRSDPHHYCIDFEWNQANPEEERYPDVYMTTSLSVSNGHPDWWLLTDPQRTIHFCAEDSPCDETVVSWVRYASPDLGLTDSHVNVDLNFIGRTFEINAMAMQMASLERFLETFESYGMSRDINVHWYFDEYPGALGARSIKLSYQSSYVDDDGVDVVREWYRRWDVGAHEVGHTYQAQLLGLDSLYTGCVRGSERHYADTVDTSNFATKEGWAEFVAMATWYLDPGAGSVVYPTFSWPENLVEVEPADDPMFSDAGEVCEIQPLKPEICNSRNEIQVLRAFWDLYDTHVDGPVDAPGLDSDLQTIAKVWMEFPDGTGNHQREEVGCNAHNMWDYFESAVRSPEISDDTAATIIGGMLNNEVVDLTLF